VIVLDMSGYTDHALFQRGAIKQGAADRFQKSTDPAETERLREHLFDRAKKRGITVEDLLPWRSGVSILQKFLKGHDTAGRDF
jgi:hypothetical protein